MTFGLRSRSRGRGNAPWYHDEDDQYDERVRDAMSDLDDVVDDLDDLVGADDAGDVGDVGDVGAGAPAAPVSEAPTLPGMADETPWHLDPDLRTLLGLVDADTEPPAPLPDSSESSESSEPSVLEPSVPPAAEPDVPEPAVADPAAAEPVAADQEVAGPAPDEQSVVLVAGRPVVVPIPAALATHAGFEVVTDPSVLAAAGFEPPLPSEPSWSEPSSSVPSSSEPSSSEPSPSGRSGDAGVWGDSWAGPLVVVAEPPVAEPPLPEPPLPEPPVAGQPGPTVEAAEPVVASPPAVAPLPAPTVRRDTFVAAHGVTKRFGDGVDAVVALDGIDLEIAEGELVAVTGPSGSGKTTLLECLSGLETPDAGTVVVHGEDLRHLSEGDRARLRAAVMGFVFQDPNLLPLLTVAENVELPLLLNGWGARDARTEALQRLDEVGLVRVADRRPAELSGGERQRAALARALVGDPHVIWADEPTAELDRESAEPVLSVIRRLHEEGRTIVVVTHDDAVAALAPRRVRLRAGRVVADDRATDVC